MPYRFCNLLCHGGGKWRVVQSWTRDLLNVREVQNGLGMPYQVLTFYELSWKSKKALRYLHVCSYFKGDQTVLLSIKPPELKFFWGLGFLSLLKMWQQWCALDRPHWCLGALQGSIQKDNLHQVTKSLALMELWNVQCLWSYVCEKTMTTWLKSY